MQMSGQFHPLYLRYELEKRLGGLHSQLRSCGKKKTNLLPCQQSNTDFCPHHSLVSIQTDPHDLF
jgi:hypothetical protein